MSPTNRTVLKQSIFLGFALFAVGFSFGAAAHEAGVPAAMACAMSLLVFAGGAQLAALGVMAAGGGVVAAVASGLVINARFLPLGMALAPVLRGGVARRALGAHLLIDASAAMGLQHRSAAAYWICSVVSFAFWNAGTFAGTQLARVVDVAAFGVDAAMPATMLALMWPLVTDRRALRVAVLAAVAAIALCPVLPSGLPILAGGALAVALGMWGARS